MKNAKYHDFREILKNVLICLLFLCAIALSALYFYRSGVLFSQKNTLQSDGDASSDIAVEAKKFDGLIIPESIAVKPEGKHLFAITQGEGYMQLIYRLVCKDLVNILGGNCTATVSDTQQWEDACSEEDFILVKFHRPISYSVIYADAATGLGTESLISGLQTDVGAIDQIFIFPQHTQVGSTVALTRDHNGHVYKFCPNEDLNTDSLTATEDFEIYINASAMTPADLFCHVSDRKDVLGSTILHSYGLNSQKITASEGYSGILEDTKLFNAVVGFFDINPDKSGSYFDEKTQRTVYVSTHGSLHVGENGISYSSAGEAGGIPLENYSDAFSNNGINTAEAIILSQSFISGFDDLDRRFLGDDAHPVLSAVYSNTDNSVTLEYIYCYSNIEIEGSDLACKLTLKNGKIMQFDSSSRMYNISDSGERRQSLSPEWVINMSLPTDTNGFFTLKYRYSTSDMFAEWVPVRIK